MLLRALMVPLMPWSGSAFNGAEAITLSVGPFGITEASTPAQGVFTDSAPHTHCRNPLSRPPMMTCRSKPWEVGGVCVPYDLQLIPSVIRKELGPLPPGFEYLPLHVHHHRYP